MKTLRYYEEESEEGEEEKWSEEGNLPGHDSEDHREIMRCVEAASVGMTVTVAGKHMPSPLQPCHKQEHGEPHQLDP